MNRVRPVCLIVGAGPGIGQAAALAFAREGFDIALASRSDDKLKIFQPALEKAGARVRCYRADAGEESSLRKMLGKVRKDLGDPQVLIYNAAATHTGKPTTLTIKNLAADFRVNVAGALACAQAWRRR